MLSLIGSALGLFSSAIPKAMDMWQDKNDKAHELALLSAQAKITLDQTAIDASIREVESVHQHDSNIKGSLRERVATFYFSLSLFCSVSSLS